MLTQLSVCILFYFSPSDYVTYPLSSTAKEVYYPWPNLTLRNPDVNCGGYAVRFGEPHSIPRMALTSRPGAGNTWTRYLMQGVTGIFTGDVYCVRRLYISLSISEKA